MERLAAQFLCWMEFKLLLEDIAEGRRTQDETRSIVLRKMETLKVAIEENK